MVALLSKCVCCFVSSCECYFGTQWCLRVEVVIDHVDGSVTQHYLVLTDHVDGSVMQHSVVLIGHVDGSVTHHSVTDHVDVSVT